MNKFTALTVAATLAASLASMATVAVSAERAAAPVRVTGEKVDSGLGGLPHYSQWADPTGKNPVVGAKVDSGLGDLPHYSQWADPTGKHPVQGQRVSVQVSQAK